MRESTEDKVKVKSVPALVDELDEIEMELKGFGIKEGDNAKTC